jgi:FlaA1/EpsC-like NDP-sugar epimerase
MNWNPKRAALMGADLVLFLVSWVLAYNIGFFETGIPQSPTVDSDNYFLQMQLLALPVILSHMAIYWALKSYRGMWRYAGTFELRYLVLGSVVWLVLWGMINAYLYQCSELFELPQRRVRHGEDELEVIPIPLRVLGIYVMMATLAAGAARMSPRLFMEASARNETVEAPRTLIVGASDVADSLLRSLLRLGSSDYRPVCAVARNPARVGLRLHGVPVVATLDKIPQVIREEKIEKVLIALDTRTPAELRQIISWCEQAEVSFRMVPSLDDIEAGRVEIGQAREIEIEDLLGREPVRLELPEERNYVRGEVVLITGAGGSIGSELARQCAAAGAARLVLIGKGENSIFAIEAEIRRRWRELALEAMVLDIRDRNRLERLFERVRPGIIFHAAAHKHVPLMEGAPDEAVRNNVFGTRNVALCAERHGANRFVMISTDKAVSPTSVMGATKRYAEQVIFSLSRKSRCCFLAVRFGNVLGSRGSVIPTFREQIKAGGPVTVTHPDVMRYFMTIPEAVSLVLQAGSQKQNGSLYLLQMGEPVRIVDLARNLISLSGFRPDVDIKIAYTGLRPGEKLREELLTEAEGAHKTDLEKIFTTTPQDVRSFERVEQELLSLEAAADEGDPRRMKQLLASLVPAYHPHGMEDEPLRPFVLEPTPAAKATDANTSEKPALTPAEAAAEKLASPEEHVAETLGELFAESEPAVTDEPNAPAATIPAEAVPEPQEPDVLEPESAFTSEPEQGRSDSLWPEDPAPDSLAEAPLPETDVEEREVVEVQDIFELPAALPEKALAEELLPEEFAMANSAEPESIPQPPQEPESTTLSGWVPATLDEEKNPVEAPVSLAFNPEQEHLSYLVSEAQSVDLPVDEIPVLPPAADETNQAPAQEQEPNSPEEIWADMARNNVLLILRIAAGFEADKLALLLKVTQSQLAPGDAVALLGDEAALSAAPAGVTKLVKGTEPEGALVADALAASPAAILLVSSSDVVMEGNALDLFSEALATSPLAYADYREDRDGQETNVALHDHEGCPHERFEFGPVIAYSTAAIASVGGVRKDLNLAWEYDLHLKLMEKAPFAHIRQVAYTRYVPVVINEKGTKVFSPGMGPLGGFSYVFYPADVEKEVTSVWEDALRRRKAWIDHPAVPVNHADKSYPLLASIVIPILNRVKYIANAVKRVQEGTFQDFEIVIVDNGSTDGTIALIESLAAADKRIRLLHGKGGSIASALNEGIRAANGKYICQLDSDDEYSPDCLEKMIGHLESHPNCGLAISYYRLMDEHGVVIEDIAPITHSGYSRNQILRRDGGGAVRIFPKAVLQEFGYYDEEHYGNFGEDYDMVLKTGEKYDVDRVHHVLYHYRRHSDNTDVTRDPAMKYKNKNRARQEALRRRTELNQKLGKG